MSRKRAKKPATPAKSKKKTAAKATPVVPPLIYAQASPKSIGGVSMFEAQNQIYSATVENFVSEQEVINRAVNRLKDAGFDILQVSQMTINIAGTADTYERAFNTKIIAEERPVIKEMGKEDTATYLDSPDTDLPGLISTDGTSFADVLEGVAIEEPRYFMAPSMFAPLKSYWHLRLPGDVSLGDNADKAHRTGITGKGIKVAMADSGHFLHPYFTGRGYRVSPVVLAPGAANPLADEVGHGTGESANIFAVAPDAELLPVKMSFVNTLAAFNTAVGLGPHIITCSWGSSTNGPLSAADQALAAAIAAAVAAGIIVVFSAGNGHAGFPGQHPDVISAGGVFMNKDESLRASDYASGFMSHIYPNRRVPDLCGLVGMKPNAIYLMLPLEPGDQIDVGNAGGAFPNGDETANNDGWAGFSGTSAAAPQLAGAAALVKQACPSLTPAQVKQILMSTARDVTVGNCNAVPGTGLPAGQGHPAGPGPDLATGNGLVDAAKAVLLAKIRCLGPPIITITPITPITPITGITPITPITGITPITPITTITPITPITTITPITPITPITGITPIIPITPITMITPPRPGPGPDPGPIRPASEEGGASQPAPHLSEDDVAALEALLKEGDIDLGN